ncbi:MAG TPA: TrmH family RNA methyltransferase [Dehalococcoidia bacterium]|nr:TrmH family RNA methyltransferase [Dehalococcoidia bacterium]
MRLKRYNKTLDYSYTFGMYPTIELLRAKPDKVVQIITHSKLSDEEGSRIIDTLTAKHSIALECNDRLIHKLSPKESCYVVGVFNKYYPKINQENHVVLVNPTNSGNLGTIIRSMLAFNFNNLVIIRPAADIFHPDTIRASMGALFGINFELFDDINRYLEVFSIHNQYLFMTEGQDTLDGVSFSPPYSLVFGSEPSGLPPRYSELGNTVRIAQSGRVDSLNLAISASIVFHHLYSRYH